MASLRSSGGVTFSLEAPCEEEEEPRRSMDACFLCRRQLSAAAEVFMYRGDTPFCSEECRQGQMELDEAREREMRYRRRRHQRRRAAPVEQLASTAQTTDAVVAS